MSQGRPCMVMAVLPAPHLCDACDHSLCATLSPDSLEGRQLAAEAKAGASGALHPLGGVQEGRGRSCITENTYSGQNWQPSNRWTIYLATCLEMAEQPSREVRHPDAACNITSGMPKWHFLTRRRSPDHMHCQILHGMEYTCRGSLFSWCGRLSE